MLQVLMRVKQEQRVTKDAHRFAEQYAAAQRYAAQVLQAIFYLGSIGLLGEYCPMSSKNSPLLERIDYMHHGSFQEYPQFCGCSWVQHSLTTEEDLSFHAQKSLEDFYMLKNCSGLNYKKSDDSTEMCSMWFCFERGCEGQTHSLHFEEPA